MLETIFQSILFVSKKKDYGILEILDLINKVESEVYTYELKRKEEKQSLGISEIKPFIDWLSLKSNLIKLGIVYDSHLLTAEAQNSLLKSVEEPPENTLIILITSSTDLILETILSRCIIRFDLSSELEKFDADSILKFEMMTFNEKDKFLNQFIKMEESRPKLSRFTEEIFNYRIKNKGIESINLIVFGKLKRAIKQNVNLQVILNYIKIIL